jgi:hypothetical protein
MTEAKLSKRVSELEAQNHVLMAENQRLSEALRSYNGSVTLIIFHC